jgi:hypothetical protein
MRRTHRNHIHRKYSSADLNHNSSLPKKILPDQRGAIDRIGGDLVGSLADDGPRALVAIRRPAIVHANVTFKISHAGEVSQM